MMKNELLRITKIFLYTSVISFFISKAKAQTVTPWITTGDQSKLLQQQAMLHLVVIVTLANLQLLLTHLKVTKLWMGLVIPSQKEVVS
jgi:hypothetical protein